LEPIGPDLETFGVAAEAKIARLATERDQVLGVTCFAHDAGKAIVQNAAVEELLDGALRCAA
jgi:hypothetical protein